MSRSVRALSALSASVVLAALLSAPAATAPPPEGRDSARAGGSLRVTPRVHVGGQALHVRGSIGRSGRHVVRLQSHLGRAGDTWQPVPGTATRTDARGRFDIVHPAPSTFRIRFRVVGAGRTTRPVWVRARPQELVVHAAGGAKLDPPFHRVRPGRPFTVVVDTSPAVRRELGVPPAFPGRRITLQERVDGGQWRTIATGTADRRGLARFGLTAPASGTRVLRARQERVTRGANRIGWYASFPAYFSTGRLPASRGPSAARVRPAPVVPRGELRPTASRRFGWGPLVFDFPWDRGQDLSMPPPRGSRQRGSWMDTSDGTGRATPFNGGLMLQSKLAHGGRGDLGTTTAMLRDNAQASGRWEFRLQEHVWERGKRPYRFRLELVPDGSAATGCAPEAIVVAGFTLGASRLEVGARSEAAGSSWRRTVRGAQRARTPVNVAVEVALDHVTWFVDGRVVAATRDRRARPGVPLVPRLSLLGGQREMNGAQVDSDWQRAWTLERGRQVRSGPALARRAYSC